MSQTIQFHQILEMIDSLSLDEQDDLINIIRHRQIEKRREEIAKNIVQARQDYQQGKVFRGNIDDIITELNND
ncbi:hypothetical protein WH8501_04775 [Crocosphaera watsonii WH 8501]|uniref:Uncharacterized protein n=6 Tax=Crocosphaera watsonii TaxID=263511 RepID=Q4C7W4_CROWT|nr:MULTISPECIES: hypothetical protein [Crocosphaera]EAM52507.1 conserved hypothetical protein [Crocosphaera watsonii WH 8501]EHJ14272.1 hypothetical protein CWATWH0003_1046 [Crocosphaera watsonii WH 0003]MCH2243461.1 hypothetical protein [Crocosphaera sp.]NQZ64106.1 hypothetical protein [Crocosphaera sp.]CCQ53180.1 conserved hypothetical protein [Crocosphaera watsonii WH 8502]